jgi:5-methylcytosine-specific restriction endonuclease McrBC regulatory subunit McrC
MRFRLVEYGSVDASGLSAGARRDLAELAEHARQLHSLDAPPISFSGPTGGRMQASHFVGVLETPEARVEVFPKLDAHMARAQGEASEEECRKALRNLAWMLEASGHQQLIEGQPVSSREEPDSFIDLLAWIFGQRLSHELQIGLSRTYVPFEEETSAIRGRIQMQQHFSRSGWRADQLPCAWDELSPNTRLNRILSTAVDVIGQRTRLAEASWSLARCGEHFEEVQRFSVAQALNEARLVRFDRTNERFGQLFRLGVTLLRGAAPNQYAQEEDSFCFFLDMNRVFEDFVGAALQSRFSADIRKQWQVGQLLRDPLRYAQIADFCWSQGGTEWVADAKYKDLGSKETEVAVADLRQLICYGQLAAPHLPRRLLVVYPTIGNGTAASSWMTTFDGSLFAAAPLYVDRPGRLDLALPEALQETALRAG